MNSDAALLSGIIFLPTLGAILLLFFNKKAEEPMRICALVITVLTFFLTLQAYGNFDYGVREMQMNVEYEWIQNWNI